MTAVVDKEHVWLSDILKMTLDKNETGKFWLSSLHESLSSSNDDLSLNNLHLTKDLMDTAMMERLGLIDIHKVDAYSNTTTTPHGLFYLYSVYEDILNCRGKNALSIIHKSCYSEEVLSYCQDLVIQYSITFLTEPDIFLYGQNRWIYIAIILERTHVVSYLRDIRKAFRQESEMKGIFDPILTVLKKRLDIASLESNIMDTFYITATDIILVYTEDQLTMEILTNHKCWFGICHQRKVLTGQMIENSTLMGRLLQASVFTRAKDFISVHFQDLNNIRDFHNTSVLLQQQINNLLTKCSLIFRRLIAKKKLYNKVLIWFLIAAEGNIKRNQLGVLLQRDPVSFYSSAGFSINVVYLALMIFEPMPNDYRKFCDRMDFSYCIRKHSYYGGDLYGNFELHLNNETTMLPRTTKIEERIMALYNNTADANAKAKVPMTFFTEWGFLCSRLIQAMYIPLFNEFVQSVNSYQDNYDVGNDWTQLQQEELLCINFAKKSIITHPILKKLLLNYCAAFSVYILEKINFHIIPSLQPLTEQPVDQNAAKVQTHFKITKDKEQAPDITYCMPDAFVGDIATVAGMANNEYSVEFDTLIQPIIIFISTMMGNTYLIQNPHLRAQMAKELSHLNKVPMIGSMGQETVSLVERTLDTQSPASELLIRIFPKNLIHIFIDIEFTGRAGAFHQKFSYRHVMYMLIKLIVRTPLLLKRLKDIGIKSEKGDANELPLFLRFINLLTNDATYLLDEALSYIAKIKDIETIKDSGEWIQLTLEDKELKQKQLNEAIESAKAYNTISLETVKALKRITTHIRGPFLTLAMKDKLAAMLNYFYFQLVSNKQSNLKVRNMSNINFDPKKLLKIISIIYSNFENEPVFVEAVAKDERSYSPALFAKAISILKKVNCPFQLIKSIEAIELKSSQIYQLNLTNDLNMSDCPEEYMDIISCEVMKDPVLLPSSRMILDRGTITRQLLSAEEDPFNRAHLTIDMVVPQPELKASIEAWIADKVKNQSQQQQQKEES